MKKNTSEKLINLLGVAAGNAILALAVVAFIVPAGHRSRSDAFSHTDGI